MARQPLEPVLAAAAGDERAALLAGAGALGASALAQPDDGGAVETAAALHGLYWFAANLASLEPLLFLVDDAQWADLSSLRWLAYLAARIEDVPLALGSPP